jgi:hypothetical protein
MKRPALVRRRSVWLPTAWGWLTLLLVAGAGAVIAARNVYSFLATTEPVGARTLVVEGWLPPTELDQAIDVFRAGGYRRIVTTGGPISNEFERWGADSYAERARSYLEEYFQDAAISIYWGSVEDFTKELLAQWNAEPDKKSLRR